VQPGSSRRLYEIELSTFDGHGFLDLAYHARDGVYETLGLAWGARQPGGWAQRRS
jgi:hypothetical protein